VPQPLWLSPHLPFLLCPAQPALISSSLIHHPLQTVVGQLKNFVAFLLGLVMFDDYIYDHINFIGLMVGFAGGVWYTYVTYEEKLEKDRQRELEKSRATAPNAALEGGKDATALSDPVDAEEAGAGREGAAASEGARRR
jgi:hypothetical protein